MSRTTVFAAKPPAAAAAKLPARPRPARLPAAPPIRVNGVLVPEDEIGREVQYHAAQSLAEAWRCAATALVVRELVLQRADELGIDAEGEDERIAALLEVEVATPAPDADACRRWYERHRASFGGRDFAAVQAVIADYLGTMSRHTACAQYVRVLIGRARIEGLDLGGAQSPLLQ